MSAQTLEAFLARLYTDDALHSAFAADPAAVARSAGLDEDAVQALVRIDRVGLALAKQSFATKRAAHQGMHRGMQRASGLLALLRRMLGR